MTAPPSAAEAPLASSIWPFFAVLQPDGPDIRAEGAVVDLEAADRGPGTGRPQAHVDALRRVSTVTRGFTPDKCPDATPFPLRRPRC